jgi:hypothetical protein
MSETRRCSGCRYWDPGAKEKRVGFCRFTSPDHNGWPTSAVDDWCGEWTAPRTDSQAGEPSAVRQVGLGLVEKPRPGARR